MPIIKDMPNKDYHATPDLSNSGLKQLRISAAHYLAYKNQEKKTADVMTMGSVFHLVMLEPEKISDQVALWDGTRRGKKWDEYSEKNADCYIIKTDPYDDLMRMREGVDKHKTASSLLAMAGDVEVSYFWNDPAFGFKCKCRPDKDVPKIRALVDVKSAVDASPKGFIKACANRDYDMQGAWYLAGARAVGKKYDEFIFIAVEKTPPYAVGVYRLPQLALDNGRAKIRPLMEKYYNCLTRDEWPGYADGVQDIVLPRWALEI